MRSFNSFPLWLFLAAASFGLASLQQSSESGLTIIATTSSSSTTTTGASEELAGSALEASRASEDNSSTIVVREPAEEGAAEPEQPPEGLEAKSVAGGADSNNPNEEKGAKLEEEPAGGEEESVFEESESTRRPRAPKSSVNMSQVDELYNEGTRSESEVVESWNQMGRRLRKTVGGLIGSVVPLALNMTQEAKISNNCSGAMLKWVLSMNHLKLWALKMLDASGKPVAGLLEGSLTMFGNYRQCLGIRAPDDDEIEFAGEFREYFRGKYCVVQAKPWLPKKERFYGLNTKLKLLMESAEGNPWYERSVFEELNEWLLAFNYLNIRMDLCIPSLCSREDIQSVLNYLLRGLDLKARVLRCETDAAGDPPGYRSAIETSSGELADALVASATTSWDNFEQRDSFGQLGWLLVPLAAVLLVLLASCLSWLLERRDDFDDDLTDMGSLHEAPSSFYKPKHLRYLSALSLGRSLRSHLHTDYSQLADEKPLALYGIRFLLVIWVITVEFAINFKFEFLRELLPLKELIFWWPLQFFINSTLQYDSLILLTAFTMSYKFCLNDNNLKIGKSLARFVLEKHVRLVPGIMITVAMAVLLPLLYRGPIWNDLVARQSAVCQSTGWLNLLFLQNYLPYKDICLPHTWLFSVELQLTLLAAPLLYYLNRAYQSEPVKGSAGRRSAAGEPQEAYGKASGPLYWLRTSAGLALLGSIVLGSAYSFYNVYSKDLPPSYLYTMPDPDSKSIYFDQHFMRLWTHLAVFAVGLLAGLECRRAARNTNLSFKGANLNLNFARAFANSKQYQQQQLSASSTSSLPTTSNSLRSHGDQQAVDSNESSGSSISINITNNKLTSPAAPPTRWAALCGRAQNCALCLLSFALMGLIIFSTFDWSMNELPGPLVAALYDSGSRLVWSLCFVCLLYMSCVPNNTNNKFSYISRLLGHPAMVSLGKLSFLIYLIHPLVHATVLGIQEQPIYSSWLMLLHVFVGNMTITLALAVLVSLFTRPFRNFFRVLTEASSEFSCSGAQLPSNHNIR